MFFSAEFDVFGGIVEMVRVGDVEGGGTERVVCYC